MYSGTIIGVRVDRGFFFVRPSSDSGLAGDVFCHSSTLQNLEFSEALMERRVLFDAFGTTRGLRAQTVMPAE